MSYSYYYSSFLLGQSFVTEQLDDVILLTRQLL